VVAYDVHRVLVWRTRAAEMRERARSAASPTDVEDFEMLASYWERRAAEAERRAERLSRPPEPKPDAMTTSAES